MIFCFPLFPGKHLLVDKALQGEGLRIGAEKCHERQRSSRALGNLMVSKRQILG